MSTINNFVTSADT